MKNLLLFFGLLTLSACGPLGAPPKPQTLSLNKEGVLLYQGQNYQGALDRFISALRYDPFQPELQLNMGLAFESLQQAEKAAPSYKAAQQWARTPEVKYMAFFNEAQLLGKAKKVDEAIELYQKALDIVPTSKEAKTNIELLTQQQKGGGQGQDQNQDNKDNKDKQQQQQQQQQKDQKDQKDKKDPKDDKDDKDKDPKDKEKEKKDYEKSPKYKPKFESKDLTESDVKKILNELRQQEQKIRAEFNRKEAKEQPRAKDW